MKKKRKPKCPQCGSSNSVPIIYGLPSPTSEDLHERGEAVLGGCIIDDENPVWHCLDCSTEWGRLAESSNDDLFLIAGN